MELTLAIAALKVVGYGLAAIGPGIGIGIATYGLCVSAARPPARDEGYAHGLLLHRCCNV